MRIFKPGTGFFSSSNEKTIFFHCEIPIIYWTICCNSPCGCSVVQEVLDSSAKISWQILTLEKGVFLKEDLNQPDFLKYILIYHNIYDIGSSKNRLC